MPAVKTAGKADAASVVKPVQDLEKKEEGAKQRTGNFRALKAFPVTVLKVKGIVLLTSD
ncbi:hypothetical protein I5M27_06405 [Adhaeribacter sp. BT258]|uniref:Uncharacterized protein n=1 Tax=Adhaeribacter terrigena TaxID=2793070 RepID=A0ABS1BZP4_9BACT|nr:hypothetical protein [Adhaeribacter terrigena]MBK0402609.1 hypothetical protein [Adhaeribacter terrigena]